MPAFDWLILKQFDWPIVLKNLLSYLRFTDHNNNFRRKQIAPVYLAASEKYRVDNDGVFIYDDEVQKLTDNRHDFTADDRKRLRVDKFRNKFDPVVGSWELESGGMDQEHAAFSYLITYEVRKR